MLRKISLLGLILFSLQHAYSYNITMKINGAPNTKFLMGYYYGDKQYIKDSAVTDASGKMTFKGKENLQGGIYLIASVEKALLFDFIVTEQSFSLETDTTDYTGNMKVKGSEENQVFFDYTKYTSKIGADVGPLEKKYKIAKEKKDTSAMRIAREGILKFEKSLNEYRTNLMATKPNMLIAKVFKMMQDVDVPDAPKLPNGTIDSLFGYNYFRTHYFDNFDFSDDRIVYTPVFHGKIEFYITKLTPQTPDSINKAIDLLVQKTLKNKEISKWCIYWITNHYETSQFMGMDAVFVHMVDKYYKDSLITYWVDETTRYKINDRADNLRNNLLGQVAPNLIMPDTGFVMRELHKINAKYTMILFWDAHCGRCKEEIPVLKKLYEKLNKDIVGKQKELEVYAVSLTNVADEWKKFVADNNLKWINVSDLYNNTKYRKLYDIYSTPVIYLLNEKKEIVAKRLSVDQVADFIEKGIQ